jgi:hypothetical protein
MLTIAVFFEEINARANADASASSASVAGQMLRIARKRLTRDLKIKSEKKS